MPQKKKTRFLYTMAFLYNEDIFYDSYWINKYTSKLMLQGKKHLAEKYLQLAFAELKFTFKKMPGYLLLDKINQFRPVLSYVNKRMGRKYNPIPMPIKQRRQYILSLNYIIKYTKSVIHRNFDDRITSALAELFSSKKNYITKKIAEDIKHLTDARIFLNYRWQ